MRVEGAGGAVARLVNRRESDGRGGWRGGEAVVDGFADGGEAEGGGGSALEAERALDGDDQLEVERVAGVARDHVTEDGPAQQREVADEVEHLVAHELVAVAQAVERAALADHDRVLERAA